MGYSISTIQAIIHAITTATSTENAYVEHILLDSRKILFPSTSLFFALTSSKRNAHLFIPELYAKGVKFFVVETINELEVDEKYADAIFLKVPNVLLALQLLVAHHRKQFNIPVIGITGSNGKTIVKEWLFQLLQTNYNIVRSPKSYNSQIGVPLSVWDINEQHSLGIFEAGVSMANEMKNLETIIQPTIGVFTNIGEAHNEGFLTLEKKIEEKCILFEQAGVVIYSCDDIAVQDALLLLQEKNKCQLFSWGKNEGATLKILSIQIQAFNTVIKGVYKDRQISISIPFTNNAAVENAISCWCVLLQLEINDDEISDKMRFLKPVEMRLELKQGINNTSVINDSYSADINSLAIALDFLEQQQQHKKRTVILSDILQTGKSSLDLYTQVATILKQKNINRFIGIGSEISKQAAAFSEINDAHFFTNTADFKKNFHSLHFNNETILLKGARLFEFEQITHLLEQKVHQTVLEVNLNAITHNLNVYQKMLSPNVKIMAMVKAFSYGSGSFEIANLLQYHKIDYLAVAYADEGVELRKAGISLPIMIMNAEESTFDFLIQYHLEPELFSFEMLQSFENYLQQSAINHYPVHIKLDTGMHRLGFEETDIEKLCLKLKNNKTFKVQSIFSHLAASDSSDQNHFTETQATIFTSCSALLQSALGYSVILHIANTAAIHEHKNLQMQMVRLGIGLYGIDSNPTVQQQLKNVSTLKTTIAQIKKVKAGDSVGYSRKGFALEDITMATVRIGYADGYPRLLSNGVGSMWLKGKLAPVIGNVCMDMVMLNITDIGANEGDEVIVFGEQLPVALLAQWANTIPYEILTNISQRVKRIYFEE